MQLISAGLSDLGNRRRNNEDRFIRDDRRGLYVVCDGMGGVAAGEVASGNSAAVVYSHMCSQPALLERFRSGEASASAEVAEVLKAAIQRANARLFELSALDPRTQGMGTTLTALVVGQDTAVVGHVGDSRAYHVQRGRMVQLTVDHTWVAEQVRKGLMTEEEGRKSGRQNLIMRALGIHEDMDVDVTTVPVMEGDRFLLCSDGLHGYLRTEEEARDLMMRAVPPQRVIMECIALARHRGGKDNVTAVLVACSGEPA